MAFGAAAGTAIVAIVIIALVTAAVAIWQLVEREQMVASTDERRRDRDRSVRAGSAARSEQGQRPRRRPCQLDPSPPRPITARGVLRPSGRSRHPLDDGLAERAGARGPDWHLFAERLDRRRHRFRVTDAAGKVQFVDQIDVPTEGGQRASVRFNGSWMVVTDQGGQPTPALHFSYLDEAATVSAGPRPAAAGSLLPDHRHHLSPNPVDAQGNFNDRAFVDDCDYAWVLERLDPGSDERVSDVPLTPVPRGGNATFTPTRAGRTGPQQR